MTCYTVGSRWEVNPIPGKGTLVTSIYLYDISDFSTFSNFVSDQIFFKKLILIKVFMGSSPFQGLELEKTIIFQWLSPNFDGFELKFDKKWVSQKSSSKSTYPCVLCQIDRFFGSKSLVTSRGVLLTKL